MISVQLARSSQNFINNQPLGELLQNPYFARYYMDLENCNLPGFSLYNRSCPLSVVNFSEDAIVESTINAVYASVDALDRAIKEICNDPDYTVPCPSFMNAPNRRQR